MKRACRLFYYMLFFKKPGSVCNQYPKGALRNMFSLAQPVLQRSFILAPCAVELLVFRPQFI